MRWPFVRRSTFDRVRLENYTLRDSLKLANEELRKHRLLIGSLRTAQSDALVHLERALAAGRKS